jgi:hypothetical protein
MVAAVLPSAKIINGLHPAHRKSSDEEEAYNSDIRKYLRQ